MTFVREILSFLQSDSLFSTIITLYTLILLYFPSIFCQLVFSPTLISTILLVLSLLRLGAAQNSVPEVNESDSHEFIDCEHEPEPQIPSRCEPDPFYAHSFVEWVVRAPLEVIYEEYEGEEAEENDWDKTNIIQRYGSLSLFYPESDSDDSSEGDFPAIEDWESTENMCFLWDEEDDREGLIEIALDDRKKCSEFEEDNLIEIDLSPAR